MFRSNYRAGILLKLDSLEVSTKRVGLESRDQLSTLLLFSFQPFRCLCAADTGVRESEISHPQPAFIGPENSPDNRSPKHTLSSGICIHRTPSIPGFFLEK
jgi:hypothetical protein